MIHDYEEILRKAREELQEELNRRFYGYRDDPVYRQCIADAVEYFKDKFNLKDHLVRATLSPENKQRVLEFLKNRKKFYGENGLIIN